MFPTIQECKALQDKYRMPENIRRHTEQVTRVAVFLAEKLENAGTDIGVGLVRAGAMLHDIARPINFKVFYEQPTNEDIAAWDRLKAKYPGMKHTEAGYLMFKDIYPEMAEMIRRHNYGCVITGLAPRTWEEKVLNYADKRVAHDRIVSLDERFEEGQKRWHNEHKGMRDFKKESRIASAHKKIEEEIFSRLDFGPDELEQQLK